MKVQIDKGNNNTQMSSDDNTVQIQIGGRVLVWSVAVFIVIVLWIFFG